MTPDFYASSRDLVSQQRFDSAVPRCDKAYIEPAMSSVWLNETKRHYEDICPFGHSHYSPVPPVFSAFGHVQSSSV